MIGKQEPQRTLWEADMLLPPKKLAALKKTWAWSFRTEALPLIDAELFRPFYCEAMGLALAVWGSCHSCTWPRIGQSRLIHATPDPPRPRNTAESRTVVYSTNVARTSESTKGERS